MLSGTSLVSLLACGSDILGRLKTPVLTSSKLDFRNWVDHSHPTHGPREMKAFA